MALLVSFVALSACYRVGERSTIAEVCRIDDGTFVSVEGFLRLPNFLESSTDPETEAAIYELFLAEQPDGKSPTIKISISVTRAQKPNGIAELPVDGYTERDLRIFTATGETVGSEDRVRISGRLRKVKIRAEQPCIVTTERIERP